MGTRATYQFKGSRWNGGPTLTQTAYIHYDGYPEHAAKYFANMLEHENTRGTLFDRFIRANEQAESTTGHDAHGDTEHRYTLVSSYVEGRLCMTLTHEARSFAEEDSWAYMGSYDLAEFINKERGFENRGIRNPFEIPWVSSRYKTIRQLEKEASHAMNSFSECLFRGMTGNAFGYVSTAKQVWGQLREAVDAGEIIYTAGSQFNAEYMRKVEEFCYRGMHEDRAA